MEPGEMAQNLRVFPTLPEDYSLVFSNYIICELWDIETADNRECQHFQSGFIYKQS